MANPILRAFGVNIRFNITILVEPVNWLIPLEIPLFCISLL